AAGRAQVGGLALVQARADQPHTTVVDVVAQVDLQWAHLTLTALGIRKRRHQDCGDDDYALACEAVAERLATR
ncbi:MAG: hypothetical protein ACLGHG_10130, partial [Gammaproteobacteria bacterium]